tara:strand:+ start:1834 stop:2616 length:783 start_codon:yes stop_codon:yes gene_type:complete
MKPIDLNYEVLGNGERKLIILHGLFGMGRNWKRIAKMLGDTHQILIVDLRNHGSSPWKNMMTYEIMAADVASLIDKICGGRADVIGHSMGGKTAMALALTHPNKIHRLAVLDISPASYMHDIEQQITAIRSINLNSISRRSEAEKLLIEALSDVDLAKFITFNLRPDSKHRYRWCINLNSIAEHKEKLLDFPIFNNENAFKSDTLFLSGDKSTYIMPHHIKEIARLFPKASITMIENAGHWLHIDNPEQVTTQLNRFFAI